MKLQEAVLIGINVGVIGFSITTPLYAAAFLKCTLATTVATIALKFFTPYLEQQIEEIQREINIEVAKFLPKSPKNTSYAPGLLHTAIHVASLFRSRLPTLLSFVVRSPGNYTGIYFGRILGNLIYPG